MLKQVRQRLITAIRPSNVNKIFSFVKFPICNTPFMGVLQETCAKEQPSAVSDAFTRHYSKYDRLLQLKYKK